MTPDEYVLSVISNYSVSTGPSSPSYRVAQQVYPIIQTWAGKALLDVSFSGSYAKNTGIRGTTDVDLFISLDPSTPGTLKEIYDHLFNFLTNQNLSPHKQNVSINVRYSGISVDLIPARKQSGNTNDHSLFRNRTQTWTQTNVQTHINLISNSGRIDEIKALKIWRNLNNLEFPSLLLELAVLEALHGYNRNQVAANVFSVFDYFVNTFPSARLVDPANSNNAVSDDITSTEKTTIANAARTALRSTNWNQIIR
ncbi:MAG: nucleotidyltransferase [Candidatus Bathyarchaeia archaeon]